jgi:hypothetical protein
MVSFSQLQFHSMYGNNTHKIGIHFKKVEGQRGGCQFIWTFCFIVVYVDSNASLRSCSISTSSLLKNYGETKGMG